MPDLSGGFCRGLKSWAESGRSLGRPASVPLILSGNMALAREIESRHRGSLELTLRLPSPAVRGHQRGACPYKEVLKHCYERECLLGN